MTRPDGRAVDELRPITFERDFTEMADGSCLVSFGRTRVLCTASIDDDVPRWMKGRGSGWVTAEYSMLPGSTPDRVSRETRGPKGRTQEIQRLIGRSLRAAIDMQALGEQTITLDCDVIQADGGTRTAAITGAYVALRQACALLVQQGEIASTPLRCPVAATSAGVVDGVSLLDLCYDEDARAEVDFNVVMTADGELVEVQGTGESHPFSRQAMNELLDLAETGIRRLFDAQKKALAEVGIPDP